MSDPHIVLLGGDANRSGVPQHITDLVMALGDHARITVISEPDKGGYSDISKLNATHYAVPCLRSTRSPICYLKGRHLLAKALKQLKPDLIWSHARMPGIMLRELSALGLLRTLPTTRLAMSIHGLPYGRGHRFCEGMASRHFEALLFRLSAPLNVVFLTQDQQTQCHNALGSVMRRHRSHVLGNASCMGDLIGPKRDKPPGRHIVMTGRVCYQKNYAAALRLMRHLPDDITLSLCGTGTDTANFADKVQELAGPAADRVKCLGSLGDVRPLLRSADAYMLTSHYEGLPIGALEASEFGLPIILADFTGADLLCKDHPCALKLTGTEQQQANEIDTLISEYLKHRDKLQTDIIAHWAARYHPDQFAEDALALLPKLLAPHPRDM